jgi:hypothetical protein
MVDFRGRVVRESRMGLKSHPELMPEHRIYAQRLDLTSAGNRKSLRLDPSTALGADAPGLLRMTFQLAERPPKQLSFSKNDSLRTRRGNRNCFRFALSVIKRRIGGS